MSEVTCHRLQPVLKEPALMDVNVLHHHVLQWGPETVVVELLIVQRAYCVCSSLAFLLLVIFLQVHLAIYFCYRYPQILQALVGESSKLVPSNGELDNDL